MAISVKGGRVWGPATDRNQLILGVDMPGPGTAGLTDPAAITTVVTTVTTYTSANNGQTVTNTRFDEQVKFNGVTGMTFINCWFRGTGSYSQSLAASLGPLIIATNALNGGIWLIDCLLEPRNPHWQSRAIQGHHISLRRCEIRHHTDGYAIVNSAGMQNDHGVRIEQCWIHDCWYASPDPGAAGGVTDNASHVDAVLQWEGGTGVYIGGNRISGLLYDDSASPVGTQVTSFTDFTAARTGSDGHRMSNDTRTGATITYPNSGNNYYDYVRDGSGAVVNPGSPTLQLAYPLYALATSIVMISPSTANITGSNGSGFTFEKNWIEYGGAVGINLNDYQSAGQPTIAAGSVWIKDNRWGPLDGSAAPSFRLGSDYTIINQAAGAQCVITGNIRTDTGAAFNQVKP